MIFTCIIYKTVECTQTLLHVVPTHPPFISQELRVTARSSVHSQPMAVREWQRRPRQTEATRLTANFTRTWADTARTQLKWMWNLQNMAAGCLWVYFQFTAVIHYISSCLQQPLTSGHRLCWDSVPTIIFFQRKCPLDQWPPNELVRKHWCFVFLFLLRQTVVSKSNTFWWFVSKNGGQTARTLAMLPSRLSRSRRQLVLQSRANTVE